MSTDVNVTSFRALEDLELSLARFSDKAREEISAAQREIEIRTEALEGIVAARRREVQWWQEAYDAADDEDDDRSHTLRKLHEAEERYDNARNWQRRVEEVCGEFERRAAEATYVTDEHSNKARLFLKARLNELHEYVGFKTNADAGVSVGSAYMGAAARTTTALSAKEVSTGVSDLAAFSLPKGFGWVRINELNPDELADLPSENDYKKDDLSAGDMRAGLELLRTRILPEIQQNPEHATREYFAELDIAENRSTSNSLAEVYGAYFGTREHIWVDRFKGDEFFRIGNGRHRIAAARQLGWTVIPARIEEV